MLCLDSIPSQILYIEGFRPDTFTSQTPLKIAGAFETVVWKMALVPADKFAI